MSKKFLTPILLPADPTLALQAATKQYVDSKVGVPTRAIVGFAAGPTTDVGGFLTTPTDISGMVVNYTETIGHVYKTTAWINVGNPSPTCIVGMAITNGGGTVVAQSAQNCTAGEYQCITLFETYLCAATLSTSRKVRLSVSTGGITYVGSFSRQGQIVVEDLGVP